MLLRAQRDNFDQRIEEFRKKLDQHKETVRQSLGETLKHSLLQLVEYFLPLVIANPPDRLLGQLSTPTVDSNQAESWLTSELESVFPTPASLVSDMTLDVQFRDVTFETLNQDGFAEKLYVAYPRVDWDKPFSEFDAAKAKEQHESQST